MISWIQRYFQKHFRLVFGLILIAMAVPLIVVYSQSSGMGRAGASGPRRPFFGLDLDNEAVMAKAGGDAARSLQMRGRYSGYPMQVSEEILSRVAGLALADQLHLPEPTEKEIAAFVSHLAIFQTNGEFDPKRYSDFQENLAKNPTFTVADANRIFRDDTRLDALNHLLGGPGYVLPGDVRDILTNTESKFTIAVASVDYATSVGDIPVTEEAIKKYYDEHSGNYEVGSRVKVSQVLFRPDEFPPPRAPTEAEIRAYYDANRARFPVAADKDAAKPDPTKPADNLDKVRPQVDLAMRLDASTRAATKYATDFTVALFQQKVGPNSPELTAFLNTARRPATPLPPFVPEAPPADLSWATAHADAISHLSHEKFFSDPINTPEGVVVLLWNDTLPPYKPMLAEVRDKVVADYREAEKRRRFSEHGQQIHDRLAAALKSGMTFEKAATAEKLDVKTYEPFTISKPNHDIPEAALQPLSQLAAGQVGNMVSGSDGTKGYFVYVAQKQLPDVTPANPKYSEIVQNVSKYLAETTAETVMGNFAEAELQKTAPAKSAPLTQ
jgi:peptidyl-prolyl cis-trans isomerase D